MEKSNSDNMSLLDVLITIKRYKWQLMGFPLVAAVLSILLVSKFVRPTWEGSAIVEIGHFGQIAQAHIDHVPIETTANALTRMMNPSFVQDALYSANVESVEVDAVRALYQKSFSAIQVKGTDLIDIRVKGYSADMAEALIMGSVKSLQKVHDVMLNVPIVTANKQIQILSNDIKATRSEIELLRKKLLANHSWNTFDANLAANILHSKSADLREMIHRKMLLEEQVSPSHTYTTKVIGSIYVPETSVAKHQVLIVFLATILGLLGAILFIYLHRVVSSFVRLTEANNNSLN